MKSESMVRGMFKLLAVVVISSSLAVGVVAAEKNSKLVDVEIGSSVSDFTLQDYRGKTHSLKDFADKRAVVVAFLGTECPLAKLYGPRLQKLADEFADDIAVIGISPNRQDSITEVAAYARIHDLKFPILKDVGNTVADAMLASRTPEVFLLDADRKVQYHGRIDDQYGVGYVREKPAHSELRDAIGQVLAGKLVTVSKTQAIGCLIGRVREPKADSDVTYSSQIARILQKRCVECHRAGEIAPFALTEYSEVAGWSEMIAEVVTENRMPPWHADPAHGKFSNDRRMTDTERQQIFDWVAAGAPEGDRSQLPEPPVYTEGWQLAKQPDQVVAMRSEPYVVPAEGTVRYQYFTVDPGFTEDKWVKAAEIIPGNRAVVHHVLVFARGRGGSELSGGGEFLAGYVPGQRAHPFPKGMAKLVEAGSKLIFQVHYTPIGTQQTDLSKIGFVFADPETEAITHTVVTHETRNSRFRIPANNDNYKVEATSKSLPVSVKLLGLMPHMHVRGKSFYYELVLPDGSKKPLLDVPAYDFNWQTSYRLETPIDVPAFAKMHCVAHFDNSEKNLNNPDPTDNVRWGDQTWDEMMIGYIDIAVPLEQSEAADNGMKLTAAKALMKSLDKNKDNKLTRDEVAKRLRRTFDRLDTDKDGTVTVDELRKLKR